MEAKRTNRDGGVSLPEDVVFEVLARLPAKTLCRFRCVCKGWCALIGNPAFVAAQRSRAGPHVVGVLHKAFPPQMLVMDMDGNVVRASEMTTMCTRTPLPTQPDLICVDEEQLSPQAGAAMVIDPAAGRAYTVFSKSDPPTPWGFTCSTSFGRATPSGAFKFIRLQEPCWHDDDGGHVVCKVATITDGGGTGPPTWRRRSAPPFVTGSGRDQKVVLNGCLYCISCKLKFGGDVHGGDDTAPSPCWNRIAAFDLESEEWKAEVINGPTLMRHHKEEELWCIALVEIKGTLAVVDAHVDNQDVTIWLLVDPEKSVWVKECRIQYRG
ncbi:F-box protein At5g65850 [Sorghum bicolor]|uniref:F-box protein At5g65850 n=1 Tax=Sorghum bicolor TaxID=4558 RepID=UPI000B4241DE|nr:F-box protein At5g65850 [Sorghum bicolor]|eukprot:XP_021317842.1 F-box protein At5g65850 [Sorghum bicolor]